MLTTPAIAFLTLGLLGLAVADDKPAEKAGPARVEVLWADLASPDEGTAARAILGLAAMPKETVPLLEKRLRPVKVDAKRIARLIELLDSEKFSEREAATRELEYLGTFIKKDLEKALEGKPAPEVKKRLQQLLARMPGPRPAPKAPNLRGGRISITNINGEVRIMVNGKVIDLTPQVLPPPPGPSRYTVRAVRAVAVLEHLGSAEAQAILRTLAGGESEALPTKAASEALKRLKK
jgi:hypothetical protein